MPLPSMIMKAAWIVAKNPKTVALAAGAVLTAAVKLGTKLR